MGRRVFLLLTSAALCWLSLAGEARTPDLPGESVFEMPLMALKLLADAAVDPCPVCAEGRRKKAFRILGDSLAPGLVVRADGSRGITVTGDCGRNEFVLSNRRGREVYKTTGKGTLRFPLVVFRYHTARSHLAGIDPEHYTDAQIEKAMGALKSGTAAGEFVIVPFRYGDGPTFIYNIKDDRLIIQCRIIKLD